MFTHIKRYLAGLLYKSYYFLVPPGESGFTHGTQFNYLNASEEGYKQVVWVYRCVNEIAKRVSSVPFVVYAEGRDGEKEEITGNHPLKSFLRKPNKLQGWAQFMRAHITLMQISGNSYWDISERIGKMPAEAWLLRPDRMLIVPGQGNDSRIARYEYTVGAQVNKVPLEDIEHWKYFDPSDDYYGLSPLYVAGSCIDTENDTNDYNKYLMRNQARPSGVLQTDTKLSDDVFKRLQSAIQGWMGAKNAGKPIILEAGLKWAQAQLSQKDSDYVNLKKLNREELCAILGVPPVLVGIMDRATYNNFSEADTILWNQTVIPELREFRDNFNMRIAPMFDDGVYIDYDLSHVEALKENEDAVHDRARKDYTGGLLKLNEARKLANQEDLPGGDFYLIPSGMTPVFGTPQAPTAIEPPAPPAEAKWHHKAYGVQLMETKSKIINLEPGQVEAYQKTFRSHQDWLIAKGAKSITPILEEYYGEVISYLKTHTDQPDAAAVAGMFYADHKKAVKAWYRDYYGKGMDYFGNLAVRDLRSSVKNHGILLTLKDDQTAFDATGDIIQRWLDKITGQQIKRVSDTTRNEVTTIIAQGIAEGSTTAEMAASILELSEVSTMLRAEMIAVTEIHTISNAGNYYGVVQTGLAEYLKKQWHTSVDGRERAWHRETASQVKQMNKPFVTGHGSKLLFPGDHSLGAPADEIVRCRCCHTFLTLDIGGLIGETLPDF